MNKEIRNDASLILEGQSMEVSRRLVISGV